MGPDVGATNTGAGEHRANWFPFVNPLGFVYVIVPVGDPIVFPVKSVIVYRPLFAD